jgi:Asp-tRNA(Asn)/Glu-tRNA(Gln) amidotransferase A subunit family amidase
MDDISFLPAHELARLVRLKKISCVELLRAQLERIDALNPALNAFVTVDGERALSAARFADQCVVAAGDMGPLHGVPISIKSCIDVSGLPAEAGSRLRAGNIAQTDAVLVWRLKAAGAIILGTSNTPEMLLAYETDNLLYGRTSNPWDLERTAGGSSGGEAAVIASGMSAGGIGSDGGGSVRVPAHFTGICGLKPTPGRIPGTGHFPECVGPWAFMGVVGPMARTVADVRTLFTVTAGHDDGDTMAAPVPVGGPRIDIRGSRIGLLQIDADSPVSEDTQQALNDAAGALEKAGAIVEPFRFPRFQDALEIWRMIFVSAADIMIRAGNIDPSVLSPIVQDFLAYAQTLSPLTAHSLLTGLSERDRIRSQVLCAMRPYAAILAPVCAGPAFCHGEGGWGQEHPADYIQTMRYSQIANVLGLPGAVVPVCRSRQGLPIGVQVLGLPYGDEIVLDVAAAVEACFGFQPPTLAWAQASTG